MRFTSAVAIARAPVDVYEYLARFENVPVWNYAISETRKITEGPVRVGTRYRQTRTLPSRREESFEVIDLEPSRLLAIRGELGPFHGVVRYRLSPVGKGTEVVNDVELRARGPLRLVAPLATARVRTAVARNLDVLKQVLESSG